MNDDASPASGNRWEPSDQPAHAASPAGSPPEPVAEPAARARLADPSEGRGGGRRRCRAARGRSRWLRRGPSATAGRQRTTKGGSTSRAGRPASSGDGRRHPRRRCRRWLSVGLRTGGAGDEGADSDLRRNRRLRTRDRCSRRPRPPSAGDRAPAAPRSTAAVRLAAVALLAEPAAGHVLVGRRRRHPRPVAGWATGLSGRPADRPGRRRPAARPGAADGPGPGAGARLRPGPARPHPPAGRLHVVQPDARPHRH